MTKGRTTKRPPWAHWYKTAAWQRLRGKVLGREPLCRFCRRVGILTQADTVDHITPHRGDMGKFFDGANLQSLCRSCHSSTKQKIEKRGREIGCDRNGMTEEWRNEQEV